MKVDKDRPKVKGNDDRALDCSGDGEYRKHCTDLREIQETKEALSTCESTCEMKLQPFQFESVPTALFCICPMVQAFLIFQSLHFNLCVTLTASYSGL